MVARKQWDHGSEFGDVFRRVAKKSFVPFDRVSGWLIRS